jgi:hypothetical protein
VSSSAQAQAPESVSRRVGKIVEARVLFLKGQHHRSCRPVTLFADDDFGRAFVRRIGLLPDGIYRRSGGEPVI